MNPTTSELENMTARAYDAVVMRLDDARGSANMDEIEEISRFLSGFRNLKGLKVLDIGSGEGRHSPFFISADMDYLGIDLSPQSVKIARILFPGARFEVMSYNRMTFEPETFDCFFCIMSLQHEPKERIVAALKNIRRVMKRGGVGFLLMPHGSSNKLVTKDGLTVHMSSYAGQELADRLDEAEFEILEAITHPFQCTCFLPAHRLIVRAVTKSVR